MNDYPDDRALLGRKAQKAAKEVAAKQAPNPDEKSGRPGEENVLVPIAEKKQKDPKLLDTVIKVLPPGSNFLAKLSTLHK